MVFDEKAEAEAGVGPDFRPLYAQVKDLMIQRLVTGAWKPGSLLPSESRLAVEFGVSQGTVRKALDELAAQNLVVRQQGRGTFIAEHSRTHSLFHFFHVVDLQGTKELPTSRLLSVHGERADREQAQRLALAPRAKVFHMLRLRSLRGAPTIVERLVVPAELFPDLDRRLPLGQDMAEELYVLYQRTYEVTVVRAREMLSAVAADALDAQHLGLAEGTPVLCIDRLALDLEARPVEWRISHCNTHHHAYFCEVE